MKLKKRLGLLSIISLFCLSGCNWKFWEKWTKGENTEQNEDSSDKGSTAEEKFTVTFDSRGGSKVAPITVKKGQTITKPNDPTKEDYSFKGWYTGQSLETLFDFSTPIVKDWILFAGWQENPRHLNLKIAVFADIQLSAKENIYNSSTGTYEGYANAGNTVHAYVSLKNHFELCKEQDVDVILMNGDIVNNAVTYYYVIDSCMLSK